MQPSPGISGDNQHDGSNYGASVSQLVQQLKQGSITKQQLFERITQLQRRSHTGPPIVEAGPGGPSPQPVSSGPSARPQFAASEERLVQRASQEDESFGASLPKSGAELAARLASTTDPEQRRHILQQIVDEKRRSHQVEMSVSVANTSPPPPLQEPLGDKDIRVSNNIDSVTDSALLNQQPAAASRPLEHLKNKSQNVDSSSTMNQQTRQDPHPTPKPKIIPRGSAVQRSSSGAKAQGGGLAAPISSRRQPSIGSTPSRPDSQKSVPTAFKFQTQKRSHDTRSEQLEMELRKKKSSECTFTPRINKNSSNVSQPNVPFQDRVRKWNETKQQEISLTRQKEKEALARECTFTPRINSKTKAPKSVRPEDVASRLYTSYKDKLDAWEKEKQTRELEEFNATCTFKPKINSRARDPSPVQPRYKEPSPGVKPHNPDAEHCTFTPQVNKVAKHMGSAQLYLSTNAFERLSRSTKRASYDGEEYSMDKSSIDSKLGDRPRSAPISRQANFHDFLERQNELEIARQENLERLRRESDAPHRPNLCRQSVKLMDSQDRAKGFLERAKSSAERKDRIRKQKQQYQDQDCTFHPKISAYSRSMKARSFEDMSLGDQARKQQMQEVMKSRAEEREMAGATFRPQIKSKNYGDVQSRLKVVTEPDTYLERLKHENELREERERKAKEKAERMQLDECTFHPEIHDAPAYVKRIARSMALSRGPKEPERDANPPWVFT